MHYKERPVSDLCQTQVIEYNGRVDRINFKICISFHSRAPLKTWQYSFGNQ